MNSLNGSRTMSYENLANKLMEARNLVLIERAMSNYAQLEFDTPGTANFINFNSNFKSNTTCQEITLLYDQTVNHAKDLDDLYLNAEPYGVKQPTFLSTSARPQQPHRNGKPKLNIKIKKI
jgi:hypothetical protein